jgi:hypothetical protein
MALVNPVQPFYAPISAGSMAHVGAIPATHVSYHVISPVQAPGNIHSVGVQRVSPLPQPITGPQGNLPVSVTPIRMPIQIPKRVGGAQPNATLSSANWVSSPHS